MSQVNAAREAAAEAKAAAQTPAPDPGKGGAEGAPSLILGTAGHIDHGKSSLVKALTGTDPDRLEEEKRRGITIELGFARLVLPSGRAMGVVDVPGHERFVRQMIAGSTGIDVALLCIAADDGVMPQTIEHVRVMELLGVRRMVVALTKTDLVDAEWVAFMQDEVRSFLAGTVYADSPIVAVSAKAHAGLDALLDALDAAAAHIAPIHHADGVARLPIDRSFTIKGSGTVVTGTLWSGSVSIGDELELLPSRQLVRVRSVQEHGAPLQRIGAGNRCALNLAAVSTDEARPGMFLAEPGAIDPTDRFDAWLTYLGRSDDPAPLASGSQVRVSHGTSEVFGRVLLMDGQEELPAGNAAFAQLRLDEPLSLSPADRFIIRSVSPVEVVAGGSVLLCHPRRRTTLAPHEKKLLDALRDGDAQAAVAAWVEGAQAPFTCAESARECSVTEPACQGALDSLVDAKTIERMPASPDKPALYARPAVLRKAAQAADNALMAFHAENPEAAGMSKAELARRANLRMSADAVDALVARLRKKGALLVEDGLISHPKAGASAKKRENELAAQLLETLDAAGFAPPSVSALEKQGPSKQQLHRALRKLENEGKAVCAGDFYFSAEAFSRARNAVVAYLQKNGSATAADLKGELGLSRKHAIPLLELLDAQGVTARSGDARTLGKRS